MRYEAGKVREVISQLRALCDPIALMGWIDKRTKYGDKPGPEPWTYTGEFLGRYNLAAELGKVRDAFEKVGVTDEVDASVWLAEHMDLIP